MSTSSIDPAATMTAPFTTTFPTTPNPTWTLPRFTPPPECLDSKSIWRMETDCYSGTAQGLYRTTQSCDYLWLGYTNYPYTSGGAATCGPDWIHPATECPVGYTPAHTVDYTPYKTTSREILCCLTAYDFEWRKPTLRDQSGSSATPYDYFCVASTLKHSNSPPMTLTAFDLSSASLTDVRVSTTIKFDPERDLLLADAITISYQINAAGTTCVPNCDNPYTGGPWPRPAETLTPAPESPHGDGPFRGIDKYIWIGVGFAVAIFLGILTCIGVCIRRRVKRKRARSVATAVGTQANGEETVENNPINVDGSKG